MTAEINTATSPLAAALAEHPLAPKVVPIMLGKENEMLPRRYVIHKHIHKCKACGVVHTHSLTYAYNEFLGRMGQRVVANLIPVNDIAYNLPIEVRTIPGRDIPVCHECVGITSFEHLPDPRLTAEWSKIYAVFTESPIQRQKPGRDTRPKAPKTIDDLLDI